MNIKLFFVHYASLKSVWFQRVFWQLKLTSFVYIEKYKCQQHSYCTLVWFNGYFMGILGMVVGTIVVVKNHHYAHYYHLKLAAVCIFDQTNISTTARDVSWCVA